MNLSPSLHHQLLEKTKLDDQGVFCGCVLDYDATTLVALLQLDGSESLPGIKLKLPCNLSPCAIIYASDESSKKAGELKDKLGLQNILRYQSKGNKYVLNGTEKPDIIAKSDSFLSSLLLGGCFKGLQKQFSRPRF